MATRPIVMPETFDGSTGGWEDWVEHFERVATVNGSWRNSESYRDRDRF